jgi:hypothetical protein
MAQRTRDNNRGIAYQEYLADRAKEIEAEKAAAQAVENADPIRSFEKSANSAALTIRQLLMSSRPVGEDVLPGERIAGRQVIESALLANWKYWALTGQGKQQGFQTKDSRAVLDTWKANDLSPTPENFSAVFQLLKDYDLLPDAEPGSPDDSYLGSFGFPVQRGTASAAQTSAAMDAFLDTGFRRNNANAKLLLLKLQETGLSTGSLSSFQIADAIIRSTTGYPENSEMTPSEQAAQKRHDYFNKIVGKDQTGRSWTEADMDKELPAKETLRLMRFFEKGHTGMT